jgi:uncharacterized protein (TIGR04222 family)
MRSDERAGPRLCVGDSGPSSGLVLLYGKGSGRSTCVLKDAHVRYPRLSGLSNVCNSIRIDVTAHTDDVKWGISDPVFLATYGTIAGVGLFAAVLWRWYGTSGGDRTHEPTAIEVAYLIDGPLGACYASIAGLWRARAVAGGGLSTIVSRGEPPAGASTLTRALHQVLRTPQSWTAAVVDGSVRQALAELKRRLIRRGWLVDDGRARRVRLVAVPLFGVAAIGMVRLTTVVGASGANGRPGAQVGLAVAVATTLVVAGHLLRQPRISTVARREVRWARRQRLHLSPRYHNWSTASPRDLMFAVALYGPPVLMACDPDFARTIGADPQEHAREPIDVELTVAEGIASVRRRRIRLWDSGGAVSDLDQLGWMLGGKQPSRFWRLMWRLQSAWRTR